MDSRFPLRLIVIAVIVTVATTLFVTGIFYVNHTHTLESEARNTKLKELSGKILLYDAHLTKATKLAAYSGDPEWEERYNRVVPQLDSALSETIRLADSTDIVRALQSTEAANRVLIDLETKAFVEIAGGNRLDALKLLESRAYTDSKSSYSAGMEKVLDLVDQERITTRTALDSRFKSVLMLVTGNLLLSSLIWAMVYRAVQHWRTNFSNEQQKRAEAEQQIRQLNSELESRISSRTAELEASRQELRHQANYDELTGLANRRNVMETLETILADITHRIYVVLIDLDHFKRVNDSLGHAGGDEILQQAASRFTEALDDNAMVARLGGDEFLVVQQHSNDTDISRSLERVFKAFTLPFVIADREYNLPLSPSIGIAVAPKDGTTSQTIVRNADIAMYAAKQQGRNTACFFVPEMEETNHRKISVESKLRAALNNGDEFELYYQPQVNLADNTIIGVEALIRWNQPELGMVPPDQFIAIAEETGLIIDIGRWVLFEAARQYRQWCDSCDIVLVISINVASRQLAEQSFGNDVQLALSRYKVPAHHFGIEITERSLIGNDSLTRENLQLFNEMGLKLALDDFGTGYSALSYLKDYPFDSIKIDKSFINSLSDSDDHSSLVQGIIRMSQSIDLIVVSEGIETAEQNDLLQSFGCDIAQGYHYGRPLPADELIKLVMNWHNTVHTLRRAA